MRRLPQALVVVVGLSLIATIGIGCKQGEGERCEQNSDCSSGLVCSRIMEVSAEAGRCQASRSVQPDAATGNDAGNGIDDDAGSDVADDAGGTDAAGSDGADDAPMTTDAVSADASSTSDGASDATAD